MTIDHRAELRAAALNRSVFPGNCTHEDEAGR